MGLTVPNSSEATYAAQSMPDARDWDILALAAGGTGVVSGCAVTAHSPANMTVDVAAGVVRIGGVNVTVSAQASNAISAAHASNPRIDLVCVNTSGTVVVTTGTAAVIPLIPAVPASRAPLAAVYVPANASTIASTAANIVDKRMVPAGDLAFAVIQASQLVNEIMNFPSLEGANDAQPEWWTEADGNATLTEVDVAGESITENYERCLKCVVATANSYFYQRYTYADQPRVKSGRVLSAIFAVWSVSSVSARIRLITSASTTVVSSTTTAAGWTILTAENLTLDGTYVDIRCEVDVGTAYFVPLGINIGPKAFPLPPRPLVRRWSDPTEVLNVDGAADPAAWTDIDCTAATSNLAVWAICFFRVNEADASTTYFLDVRRNGSSKAIDAQSALARAGGVAPADEDRGQFEIILDAGQIFEYILDRTAGASNLDIGRISVTGWLEWG